MLRQGRFRRARRGFTLVQLLGIIATLAVLSAILFPTFVQRPAYTRTQGGDDIRTQEQWRALLRQAAQHHAQAHARARALCAAPVVHTAVTP